MSLHPGFFLSKEEKKELIKRNNSLIFSFSGDVFKDNNEAFTDEEKEELLDSFIEFIEDKKMSFVGWTK